jgi:hypothetical protein
MLVPDGFGHSLGQPINAFSGFIGAGLKIAGQFKPGASGAYW